MRTLREISSHGAKGKTSAGWGSIITRVHLSASSQRCLGVDVANACVAQTLACGISGACARVWNSATASRTDRWARWRGLGLLRFCTSSQTTLPMCWRKHQPTLRDSLFHLPAHCCARRWMRLRRGATKSSGRRDVRLSPHFSSPERPCRGGAGGRYLVFRRRGGAPCITAACHAAPHQSTIGMCQHYLAHTASSLPRAAFYTSTLRTARVRITFSLFA